MTVLVTAAPDRSTGNSGAGLCADALASAAAGLRRWRRPQCAPVTPHEEVGGTLEIGAYSRHHDAVRGSVSVDVAPATKNNDVDQELVIEDLIDEPVVADAHPIRAGFALQLHASWRAGIVDLP